MLRLSLANSMAPESVLMGLVYAIGSLNCITIGEGPAQLKISNNNSVA
jgi:hypothetical protein